MSDGKKAIKRDLDAETIAKYRALEERYLAELRPEVGYSPRQRSPRLSSGEVAPTPVVELKLPENQP